MKKYILIKHPSLVFEGMARGLRYWKDAYKYKSVKAYLFDHPQHIHQFLRETCNEYEDLAKYLTVEVEVDAITADLGITIITKKMIKRLIKEFKNG